MLKNDMYIDDNILCFKVGLGNHQTGSPSEIYGNFQAYFTKNDVMSDKS